MRFIERTIFNGVLALMSFSASLMSGSLAFYTFMLGGFFWFAVGLFFTSGAMFGLVVVHRLIAGIVNYNPNPGTLNFR